MSFDLLGFINRNRSKIIEEWVQRLHTEVGEQYSKRPLQELVGTITEAFNANSYVVVHNDFSYINKFIDKITRLRLEAGFLLSDVQKAFELYRSIVIPLLAREADIEDFQENIIKINNCLAYTIHRFSDHFQNMHEKNVMDYAQRLEEEVRSRTAELNESQLKYKTLVEEINDGYFVIQDRIIIFANKAFCQIHGYKLEEVLGKEFSIFVAPESQKRVAEIYTNSLAMKPTSAIFEYMRINKDGNEFPTEIMAKVTRYENRLSNIGICRDITERVKMEQRVRETERMAYIGQITTSLSHEIRNPLSAVKMNLQILKKNPRLYGNDQRRVEISVKEMIRLERILKELLDFARPVSLKFSPCNINKILSSCVELLEMRFKDKRLSTIFSLDSDMPMVFADEGKLEQVFINLLLNAIEACDQEGHILIRSRYDQDESKPMSEIIIEDKGNGIPERQISNIFKPFFTTKTKGTGLGLANVDRIVKAHGGWVKVKSINTQGTFFHIFLPVGEDYVQNTSSR